MKALLFVILVFSASVYADTPSKMNFDEILTRSAQGDAEAQARLGEAYLNGNYNQTVNYSQSFKWLTKSAASGNSRAKLDLGILYLNGYGVPFDYTKALSLFEQGYGVKRDYQKAINLYLKHINRMDHITAPSFVALGDIYSLGLGVEKNPQLAQKWYQKANDAGNTEHQQVENH